MTWLEALPPLVIITVCIAGVGAVPSAVHRGFNGGKVCRAASRAAPRPRRAASSTLLTLLWSLWPPCLSTPSLPHPQNRKVQRDHFALLMERRDARIDAEAASAAPASK